MDTACIANLADETAAQTFVEELLWPNGPVCPRCGEFRRVGKLTGPSTRAGTYKCYGCRQPFTVRIGTILESSHVPIRTWLRAIDMVARSSGQISANRLHKELGVSLRTASHMKMRIGAAIRSVAPRRRSVSRAGAKAEPPERTPSRGHGELPAEAVRSGGAARAAKVSRRQRMVTGAKPRNSEPSAALKHAYERAWTDEVQGALRPDADRPAQTMARPGGTGGDAEAEILRLGGPGAMPSGGDAGVEAAAP